MITIKDIYGVDIITDGDYATVAECLTAEKETPVSFANADLSGEDLSGADLTGINLSGADLYLANMTGADVSGANLTNANLFKAILTDLVVDADTIMTGANMAGAEQVDVELVVVGPAVIVESESNVLAYNGTIDGDAFILHIGMNMFYNQLFHKQFLIEMEAPAGTRTMLTVTPTIDANKIVVSGKGNISLTLNIDAIKQFGRNSIWNDNKNLFAENYVKLECTLENFIG